MVLGGGITPTQMRDQVLDSMRSAQWDVVADGATGLTIIGNMNSTGGQASPIKQVKVSSQDLKPAQQPAISGNSGVDLDLGLETTGDPWRFVLSPTEAASTIQQDAVIRAVIDGVHIHAPVTFGMTAVDVAFALYGAMVNAGMKDVQLFGSEIVFLANTSGQETVDTSLQFTSPSPGGIPTDWLETAIAIPERTYVSSGSRRR